MAERATVATGGFSMDYLRFGQGQNALVILPGLSVQSVMRLAGAVETAYRKLAADFTIYLLDRRKAVPSGYSMHDMARDTEAALDALGIEEASIFGASQGGMIALQIAIERPDLVRSLILGSTAAQVTDAQFRIIDEWISLAQRGDAEGLYQAFGKAIFPQEAFEQFRGILVNSSKGVTNDEMNRFIVLARSLKGFDITQDLKRITCPVLVLGDKDDSVLGPHSSEQLAEELGGAARVELHLYDGYGHAAYDLAPDYKERMLRFLTA